MLYQAISSLILLCPSQSAEAFSTLIQITTNTPMMDLGCGLTILKIVKHLLGERSWETIDVAQKASSIEQGGKLGHQSLLRQLCHCARHRAPRAWTHSRPRSHRRYLAFPSAPQGGQGKKEKSKVNP